MRLSTKIILWLSPVIFATIAIFAYLYQFESARNIELTRYVASLAANDGARDINNYLQLKNVSFWLFVDNFATPSFNTRSISASAENQVSLGLASVTGFSMLIFTDKKGQVLYSNVAKMGKHRFFLPRNIIGKAVLDDTVLRRQESLYRKWKTHSAEYSTLLMNTRAQLDALTATGEKNSDRYRQLQLKMLYLGSYISQPFHSVYYGGKDIASMAGLPFRNDTYLFIVPTENRNRSHDGYMIGVLDWTAVEDKMYHIESSLKQRGLEKTEVLLADCRRKTLIIETKALKQETLFRDLTSFLRKKNPGNSFHSKALGGYLTVVPVADAEVLEGVQSYRGLEKRIAQGDDAGYQKTISEQSRHYLITYISENDLARYNRDLLKRIAFWLFLTMILLVSLILLLSKRIVRPITVMSKTMKRISEGKLNSRVPITGRDELGHLASGFNDMADAVEKNQVSIDRQSTELRNINRELENAKDAAEEANRAKSEFFANMSHELRTPLNAVIGFSELLLSIVTNPRQKSYVDSIKTAGKNLLVLINDLLDLSKIEAGKMEIRFAPAHIQKLFSDIELIFKELIRKKGLEFLMDVDPCLPETLILDEARLRQILLNIVGNAVKFTHSGHIRVEAMKINTEDRSKIDLFIAVHDTGIGIPKDALDAIFESFTQHSEHDVGKFGGTGLGLAICRRLLSMMNGEIVAESEQGKGSTFKIILRNVNISSTEAVHVDGDNFSIDNITFENSKILVVDDVESNRNMLYEIFTRSSMDVMTAENGQDAIEIATEFKPDVIIMDIRMPVMDGIECTRIIKSTGTMKDIPIIALTASAKSGEEKELLEMGFAAYLRKPVNIRLLYKELAKYLTHGKINSGEPANHQDNTLLFTEESIQYLPELTALLENEVLPLMDTGGVIIMDDVKRAGELIYRAGNDFGIEMLISYAAELQGYVDSFDIAGIEGSFVRFHKIIKILKDAMEQDYEK